MPSNSNSGSSNTGSNSSSGGYTVTSSGTNSQVGSSCAFEEPILTWAQGNHYDSRDYGSSASNSNSYHYSNSDGSYYYSNPNGETTPSSQGPCIADCC